MSEKPNRKRFFASSNSEAGFVSYFDENFRQPRAGRCYIIKGGPGTGKSRLMQELAAAAEGAGAQIEYYYCSSDPLSLDGIFVSMPDGNTLSVIDGTAPHTANADIPGAVDNIIDLGVFWDSGALHDRLDEILRLNAGKSAQMRRAGLCLASAGSLLRAAEALLEPCIRRDALLAAAERTARLIEPSEALRSPLSCHGMRHGIAFDSFRENADEVLPVGDRAGYGCTYLFLGAVADALGGRCRTSPDPLLPERITGLTSAGTALLPLNSLERAGESIDISAFVDREAYGAVKAEYNGLRELASECLKAADTAFDSMAVYHFTLESIYSSAMDFERKEAYSAELCRNMFKRNLFNS